MLKEKTAKKIKAFVSKMDTTSKLLIASIVDGKISRADAIKQVDASLSEVQKIYSAINSMASTRDSFVKASKNEHFEASLSSVSAIATRLDLVKQMAESIDDEEDYEDVSSDEILEDMGVSVEEPIEDQIEVEESDAEE